MHLIQGTLDSSTTLLTSAAGIFAFGAAAYGARRHMKAEQVLPLLGMSAFVFVAQMVDVATGFGFSSHLVGAALLAVLFSPFAAMLSMAAILTLQVVLLGDGSWSTLGANFLSMGVVAPCAGYAVYRLMQGARKPQADFTQLLAMTLATTASVFAALVSVGWMTGTALTPLLSVAGVWSILEVIISVAVFALCARGLSAHRTYSLTLKPIAALCVCALCLAPFSSHQADGVEHVLDSESQDVG